MVYESTSFLPCFVFAMAVRRGFGGGGNPSRGEMGSGSEVGRGSVRCWRTEWEEQGEGQFRETISFNKS